MNTNIKTAFATSAIVIASLLLSSGLIQANYVPLTRQMGIGSTGINVTNLQTFLASNTDIYPAGRITGYYGPLTAAAVQQYQLSYGISMVGAVGPITLASVNSTMAKGYGIDVYGTAIYNVTVQPSSTSATIAWSTADFASGKVYYSTTPFSAVEAVGNFTAPSIFGGANVSTAYAQSGQSVLIGNLQNNTTYFYIIETIDASGNVSVTNTSTFVTR